MDVLETPDRTLERRFASQLLDVMIRAGILLAVVILCYRVFAPFLTIAVWALIFAVTLYPLHLAIVRRLNGRQGLSATLLVILGIAVLVVPTAVLVNSLGDTVQDLFTRIQNNTIEIPAPSDRVAAWPFVGDKVHTIWARAHDDLPGLIQSMQPKIGEVARAALAFVAGIAGGLLSLIGAFIIGGIFIAFGEPGARVCRRIFARVVGEQRGDEFTSLSAATIRAVAQGVVGVAVIQAIIIGLCLLVAGVPWAGAIAGIVLILGIAQIPAVIVTLPAIAYIWSVGTYGSVAAVLYTVLLLVAGMADNVLKPLMLGRGVDVPMPIILIGTLGGMAAAGILGMFVGATLLALAYQMFTAWVDTAQD